MRKKKQLMQELLKSFSLGSQKLIINNFRPELEVMNHLKEIIFKEEIPSSKVVVLTPTGASNRMDIRRIKDFINEELGSYPEVLNIHQLGYEVLKVYLRRILGRRLSNPRVTTYHNAISRIRENLKEQQFDLNHKQLGQVFNWIREAKAHLIYPKDVSRGSIYYKVYSLYEEGLGDAYDYDDLVSYAVKALQENPRLLEFFRLKYRHLIIYNYQDLTWAQHKLLHFLSDRGKEISVLAVASEFSFPNTFRYARKEGITKFVEEYEKSEVIFRRRQEKELSVAIASLAKNIVNPSKDSDNKCESVAPKNRSFSRTIKMLKGSTPTEEVEKVVGEISKLLKKGVNPLEIGIIYWLPYSGRKAREILFSKGISFRDQQLPYKNCLVKEDGEIEQVDFKSIALLNYNKASGFRTQYLFMIGLDQPTALTEAMLPEALIEEGRRELFSSIIAAEKKLYLSWSTGRVGKKGKRDLHPVLKSYIESESGGS